METIMGQRHRELHFDDSINIYINAPMTIHGQCSQPEHDSPLWCWTFLITIMCHSTGFVLVTWYKNNQSLHACSNFLNYLLLCFHIRASWLIRWTFSDNRLLMKIERKLKPDFRLDFPPSQIRCTTWFGTCDDWIFIKHNNWNLSKCICIPICEKLSY